MNLCDIKGVGEKRKNELESIGIFTPLDLITFFPSKYIQVSFPNSIQEVKQGQTICVNVKTKNAPQIKYSKNKKRYIECIGECGGCEIKLIWFNAMHVLHSVESDIEYTFQGKVGDTESSVTLINPLSVNKIQSGMIPVYPLKNAGISQNIFHEIVCVALEKERIKTVIKNVGGLIDINSALAKIHSPKSYEDVAIAKSRLAIEEILQLTTAVKFLKEHNKSGKNKAYYKDISCLESVVSHLPYKLTAGQENALKTAVNLLKSDESMNGILIGDVGCGKTVVAMLLMKFCNLCGYQAAMLAPTEILASQHYENALRLFSKNEVAFLCGSMSSSEKNDITKKIENGEKSIIIGTHAIFQEKVRYNNLGLVITDEQHRFGVRQRLKFVNKGDKTDVLLMSATPIPRTLSLAVYGDLDIITIEDKPSNRKTVKTSVVPYEKFSNMIEYVKKENLKTYMICPAIYKNEDSELSSVEEVYGQMQRHFGRNVGMLHGDMLENEKQTVTRQFKNGDIRALVSTSIVEVGVDIKDADVIIIFDAERFGLSSLHQLRGRVGRGNSQGYCFLLSKNPSDLSKKRLKILCENTSGFAISEKDFSLRGSGDFLGDRQSGFVNAVFKNVSLDGKIVKKAQEILKENSEIIRKEFLENAFLQYKNIAEITL